MRYCTNCKDKARCKANKGCTFSVPNFDPNPVAEAHQMDEQRTKKMDNLIEAVMSLQYACNDIGLSTPSIIFPAVSDKRTLALLTPINQHSTYQKEPELKIAGVSLRYDTQRDELEHMRVQESWRRNPDRMGR